MLPFLDCGAHKKILWKLARFGTAVKGVFPQGVLGTKCRKLVALIALSHFRMRFGLLSRNLLHASCCKVVAKLSQICRKVVAKCVAKL